jgi:hypothetical protein
MNGMARDLSAERRMPDHKGGQETKNKGNRRIEGLNAMRNYTSIN